MTTAVVYTDEHGEARVLFSAGTGFFFNALPVNINLNGGCDLAGVTTLGTAPITATARYPFENVTARPVASNVLTKTITSAFSKTITCVPKGTGANNQQVAICFATAVDITGDVIPGETVCFTADLNAESIIPFPEVPGQTVTVAGTTLGPPVRDTAAETGTNMRCMVTNDSGNAAVEIVNSNATTVDVTAKFVEEGLFRFLKVTFPITQTVTSSGNAAGSSQTGASSVPAGGNNSSGSNTTAGSNSSGSNSTASNNPAVQYTIAVARLVRTAKGKATLIVRLKGPAGKANLLIKITGKHKTVAYQRAVVANRLVKIRGLRMPTKTGALRVSLSFVT
jgi:hypothetical protein